MMKDSFSHLVKLFISAATILSFLAACHSDEFSATGYVIESEPEPITESGLYTLSSSGEEREYYVSLPPSYDLTRNAVVSGSNPASLDSRALPLLIALHGAGDSYEGWLAGGFQGDGLMQLSTQPQNSAIMVMPNARENAQGRRIWDTGTETDYDFFLDLLAELDQRISYDDQRIFLTGHSAGALMTHELGCRFGDIIRGIAPSAGSITSSITPRCTGSTAVLQIQSEFDSIVPASIVTGTRDLWVLYNGFDLDAFLQRDGEACVDYSISASDYPVLWCLHASTESDGHAWWSESDQTIYDLFFGVSANGMGVDPGLPIVEPTTDPPPGGGNDKLTVLFPTNLTATVEFPAGMADIVRAGMFLYPEGFGLPISGAPQQILNGDIDFSNATIGTQQTFDIPVILPPESRLPQNYTLVLAVYVEGGSFPIPTAGVDHNVIYELTVNDSTTPILISEVLVLEPVLP
jgi:predicted esterase